MKFLAWWLLTPLVLFVILLNVRWEWIALGLIIGAIVLLGHLLQSESE